jgi:hypothetical protein
MKFLVLSQDDPEKLRIPPTPEQFAAIGAFMEEANEAGVVYLTGGIRPAQAATTISYVDGKRSVTDGPYAEAKELVAGFAILEVPTTDEAVEWVSRFAIAAGIDHAEIRELFVYGGDVTTGAPQA